MTNLTIDINGRCNEECEFCYADLDDSVLQEKEIFRIVEKYPQTKSVEIGGGEPFLDKRIVDITKGIRKRGKNVHISTNGTVIPEGFLDLEEQVRQGVQIQFSIHGSNPEAYQRIHKKNLFNRVVDNIQSIKPRFTSVMTSAICQENFNDVPYLVELAEKLDLPLRVNLVFPIGNGKNVNRLNTEQIDQLRGYLLGQRLVKNDRIDSPLIHTNNCYAIEEDYGIQRSGICPVDCGKVYVSSKGEEFGCEFYRQPVQLIQNVKLISGGENE